MTDKWTVEAPEYDLRMELNALFLTAANAATTLGPSLTKLVTLKDNPFPCTIHVTSPDGKLTKWKLDRQINWQFKVEAIINEKRNVI
mgnify:CR=1 FL=1